MSKLRINELESLETGRSLKVDELVLTQDLSNPDKGALMVRGAVIHVDTVADLQALPSSELVDGQQFKRKEFWPGTGVGGVDLYWDASRPVSEHNGGTIVDPAKISDLDPVNKTFGTYFTPDTVSGNTGCFVVALSGSSAGIDIFGATPSAPDNKAPIQACIDVVDHTIIPKGDYIVSGTSGSFIALRDNISITGESRETTRIIKEQSVANVGPIFSEPSVEGDFVGLRNFEMSHISLVGNGLSTQKVTSAAALLRIYVGHNIYLHDSYFYKSRNYGVGIQGRATLATPESLRGPSTKIIVERCEFFQNGRAEYLTEGADTMDGIDIKSSIGATIRDCKAYENGDKGIDVRGADALIENCETFGNASNGIVLTGFKTAEKFDLVMGGTIKGCYSHDNGLRNYQTLSDSTADGDDYGYPYIAKLVDCRHARGGTYELESSRDGTAYPHKVKCVRSIFTAGSNSTAFRNNPTLPVTDIEFVDCDFDGFTAAIITRDTPSGGSNRVEICKFYGGGTSGVALTRNAGVITKVIGNDFSDSPSGTVISTVTDSDYAIVKNNTFRDVGGSQITLTGTNNVVNDNVSFTT